MEIIIDIHHSSYSATINGKYVETNSIDRLIELIGEEYTIKINNKK